MSIKKRGRNTGMTDRCYLRRKDLLSTIQKVVNSRGGYGILERRFDGGGSGKVRTDPLGCQVIGLSTLHVGTRMVGHFESGRDLLSV